MVKFDSVIRIKKPGYIYVYLTYENESNNYVYFDDLKVTYTKSQVVQSNNYYAFGLQTKNSWTRMATQPNQYLYNAGSELNEATSNYEMMYRSYDPAIGRMNGVDPMVDKYASMTPYNYSMNDPIYYNDPSGAEYEWASMGGCGCWRDKGAQDGGGQSNGVYGSNSGMYGSGWNAATYGTGFAKGGVGTRDESPTYGEINARNWVRSVTGNKNFNAGQTLSWTQSNSVDYITENLNGEIWIGATIVVKGAWVQQKSSRGGLFDGKSMTISNSFLYGNAFKVGKGLLETAGKEINTQRAINKALNSSTLHGVPIKVPKAAKFVGKFGGAVFTVYGIVETERQYQNDEISLYQRNAEQVSNGISAIPVIGTGWGWGWEIGRMITNIPSYQTWKQETWLPWRTEHLGY